MKNQITHQITVNCPIQQVWELWTKPTHIAHWNNIDENWHTPVIEVDLTEGGHFLYKMQSRDGREGFDYTGRFDTIIKFQRIEYTLNDGRRTVNIFTSQGEATSITETFESENQTPIEIQKEFCLKILESFKHYAESSK
jgi:uncharacterized protein YndB with AHSA1/START domain